MSGEGQRASKWDKLGSVPLKAWLLGLCACVLVCVLSPLALGLDMEDENA